MDKFRCESCSRDFSSQEGLNQHRRDKHGVAQSSHELKQLKKQERERQQEIEKKRASRSKLVKRSAYAAIPAILIIAAFAVVSSRPPAAVSSPSASASEIPNYPIHWHPTLEILVNGQQQTIPPNLGLTGVHQPIHTHDSTGTLHYEISNPTPENMPLRYFFDRVWRKQFSSACIMNNCNGESGTVRMFVNGQENFEFENYIPKDKDEILIEYG